MIGIEAQLLASILRQTSLRQPLSCGEGLELANSIIEGTQAKLALMDWKKNHLKNGPNYDTSGTFGQHYWQNFCQRNTDIITWKQVARFNIKRDDWCRLENFADMYDGVYGKLVNWLSQGWEKC
jgi:hypothetical protein